MPYHDPQVPNRLAQFKLCYGTDRTANFVSKEFRSNYVNILVFLYSQFFNHVSTQSWILCTFMFFLNCSIANIDHIQAEICRIAAIIERVSNLKEQSMNFHRLNYFKTHVQGSSLFKKKLQTTTATAIQILRVLLSKSYNTHVLNMT